MGFKTTLDPTDFHYMNIKQHFLLVCVSQKKESQTAMEGHVSEMMDRIIYPFKQLV